MFTNLMCCLHKSIVFWRGETLTFVDEWFTITSKVSPIFYNPPNIINLYNKLPSLA